METANKTSTQGAAGERGRRVLAILLSLVVPGAGHFVLGAFGRGVAWASAPTVLMLSAFFLMPVSLTPFLVCVLIVSIRGLAAAIDTARLELRRASWKMIMITLGALFVANVLFNVLVYL